MTKGFLERKNIKPFGLGHNEDDLRQNVNMSAVQRENVWHPFYEIKVEDEDFREKLMKSKQEKKAEKSIQSSEIEEKEKQLKLIEEKAI